MKEIDCFIIGHNEMDISRQLKLFRFNYGENSNNYRERRKFNLAHIKHNGKIYSLTQAYNQICNENSSEDLVISNAFSLTVAYLGSYLVNKGLAVDYVNSFNSGKEYLAKKLEEDQILTIAITTTYYLSALPIVDIVSFIRKYSSKVKIIIGGPFITNQIADLDKGNLETLYRSLGADIYINSSEGEEALSNVVNAVKNNLTIDKISNVICRENEEYIVTPCSREENDINENRVNWKLFKDRIGNNVNIRTSISCPFSCSFCSFPKCAGKYRSASLETIEHELDMLRGIGTVKGISFIDDTFNYPPERLKGLLRMMIKNKYEFKWSSFFRCQHADEEMVELMKQSGCIQVFCGMESGNQQILDNLNKRTLVNKYREGFKLLHKYGISSVASVFIGFPGETLETFQDTYNLIEEVQPDFYQARLWWYDHHAPVYEQRDKYGLKGSNYEWSHKTMDANTAIELADQLVLNIKNSIHVTEYPIPFNMQLAGYSLEQVKRFIKSFSMCIREGIEHPDKRENSEELVETLRNSLNH